MNFNQIYSKPLLIGKYILLLVGIAFISYCLKLSNEYNKACYTIKPTNNQNILLIQENNDNDSVISKARFY